MAFAQSNAVSLGAVPNDSTRRLALVIGNDSYPYAHLNNPTSDAEGVAEALAQLGFEVMLRENLSQREMVSALSDFGSKLRDGDIGLLYYAGHGVQVNGRNYMVPIDAKGAKVADVRNEMVDVDLLMARLRRIKTYVNIIMLDACRDNPWLGPNGWFRGLAPPTGAPPGTAIAYSTDPGNLAKDGPSKHSPYARALLKFIRQPGLSLDDFFKAVATDVNANTDGAQNPWVSISLGKPFFFRSQAYVVGRILGADDDVLVILNGEEVLSWNQDGSTPKRLGLRSGDNLLTIKVYNQKTFTPGVNLQDINPNLPPGPGHLPEGWNYSLTLCSSRGNDCRQFTDREDRPTKDGPHQGKLFTVATGIIHVDEQTGKIALLEVNDKVWQQQK